MATLKTIRELYISDMRRNTEVNPCLSQSNDISAPYILLCNYADATPKLVCVPIIYSYLLLLSFIVVISSHYLIYSNHHFSYSSFFQNICYCSHHIFSFLFYSIYSHYSSSSYSYYLFLLFVRFSSCRNIKSVEP